MTKTIDEYVKFLPEIYQRIWNHPEYDDTSRLCEDRAEHIVRTVSALQEKLGKKNLRVLDLGCAQGYFCFTLAEAGCMADGIDFCKQNIDLCNALQEENGLSCTFTNGKLTEDFIDNLKADEYDVALCLSVIHHVCNENGFDYGRRIFEKLAGKVQIVITELAVKDEPLYWNKNLPERYEDFFDKIAFFNEIAFFPTHLSQVVRPLIVFSNRYFFCENKFFEFGEWKTKAYDLKPEDKLRRYFINDNQLMKFCHSTEYFINEITNEVKFLREYPSLGFTPKVLAFEKNEKGVTAVYEINKGKLLLDSIKDGDKLDYDKIFYDLLKQCVALEELELYHGDLRIWNVCIKDGEAFMIDFGNIQASKEDSVARLFNPNFDFTVYDAVLSLFFDVLTAKSYDSILNYGIYNLSTWYDFSRIEQKYAVFFGACLLIPKNELNFTKLLNLFNEIVIDKKARMFSDSENIQILSALQRRGLSEKADFITLKKNEIDFKRLKNSQPEHFSQLQEKCSWLENRISEQERKTAAYNEKISVLEEKIFKQNTYLSEQDQKILELGKKLSEQELMMIEQGRQISDLKNQLTKTYNLLVNTRHRTLYGACAWLWHKIFKKR